MSGVYVALLRGVNVGGKNKIAMAALRSMFEAAGHTDVATYIQSGNVVFRTASAGKTIAPAIEAAIVAETGLRISVIVVSLIDLDQLVHDNPFAGDEYNGSKVYTVALNARPSRAAIGKLDPNRSPPDRFVVVGSAVFLDLPNGAGRTKLTIDYLERTLAIRATARNRNTIETLHRMAHELAATD